MHKWVSKCSNSYSLKSWCSHTHVQKHAHHYCKTLVSDNHTGKSRHPSGSHFTLRSALTWPLVERMPCVLGRESITGPAESTKNSTKFPSKWSISRSTECPKIKPLRGVNKCFYLSMLPLKRKIQKSFSWVRVKLVKDPVQANILAEEIVTLLQDEAIVKVAPSKQLHSF